MVHQAALDEAGLRVIDSADLRKIAHASNSAREDQDVSRPSAQVTVETSVA
jgi:hypothetical protein